MAITTITLTKSVNSWMVPIGVTSLLTVTCIGGGGGGRITAIGNGGDGGDGQIIITFTTPVAVIYFGG